MIPRLSDLLLYPQLSLSPVFVCCLLTVLSCRSLVLHPPPLAPVGTIDECAKQEYFLSEDVSEVLRSIKELKSPAYHYEIVKRGINMSLDAKDHEVWE